MMTKPSKEEIDYRKQFWIDLANSDWAHESQKRIDAILIAIIEGDTNAEK